jgi:hypothetical protein
MGSQLRINPYHEHSVRSGLTRNLGRRFPDVRDEIVCAFDEVLSLNGQGQAAVRLTAGNSADLILL